MYGISDVVGLLFQHPRIDINKGNKNGETPLILASKMGKLAVMEMLLQHPQSDVNKVRNDGQTALHSASSVGRSDEVARLLRHPNIDANMRDNRGKTALHLASLNGNTEIVKILHQHPQLDINIDDNLGRTALHYASEAGHLEAAKLLLLHPQIHVNTRDKYLNKTYLHYATERGHLEVVEMILQHPQVDVNIGDNTGRTALHLASEYEGTAEENLLLQHPQIDVNKENKYGETVLWDPNSSEEAIKLLIFHPEIDVLRGIATNDNYVFYRIGQLIFRDDFNCTDSQSDCPIRAADGDCTFSYLTGDERYDYMQDNCRKSCKLCSIERKRELFLVSAVVGDVTKVKEQLVDNADLINYVDKQGMTALIWASKEGHIDIVRLLLNTSQVDLNRGRKRDGATALMLASYNGHVKVVEILLRQDNIDVVRRTTSEEDSALLMASSKGHEAVVKLLVATYKFDINEVNIDGESPLYKASKMGHLKIVEQLLKNKDIDINQATVDRATPLMASTKGGYYHIVKILLRHPNMEANFADSHGKTALFYSIPKYYNVDHHKIQDLVTLLLRCPSLCKNHLDESYSALNHTVETGLKNLTALFEPKNLANLQKSGHTCCSDSVNDGLQIAAKEGHLSMVKAFLRCRQVDLNDGHKYGITPLYMATKNNKAEVVKVLLDDPRTDVNRVVNSENALIKASENGNILILEYLLKHSNIDVNQINNQNRKTSLIVGAELGFHDVVELLVGHPQTFVNLLDSHSESALQKAVDGDYRDVYELLIRCRKTKLPHNLLKNIGNQSAILAKGPTCCINVSALLLDASIENNFRGILGLLQCPNIDINAENKRGMTSIYLASLKGHLEAVKVLVNNSGLEINKGTVKDGSTPFSIASEKGHFLIMKILIGDKNIDSSAGWCKDNWAHHSTLCKLNPISASKFLLPTSLFIIPK